MRFFINSYFVAGVVTVLTLFIAILTAYGFSRYTFRFKSTLSVFIISTQTVPPITLLIPYFGMVVAFGIFDTYLALIVTYMVFTLPYAVLLMTGYLNTLPGTRRGGAGRWRVELDGAVAGDRAGLPTRHRGNGGLHLPARTRRIPLRSHADQIDGPPEPCRSASSF